MAQITLRYDARNSKAKAAIEFLLKLGFFEVEEPNEEDPLMEQFYKDFEEAVKEAKEISKGTRQGKLLEDVLNEIQ